MYAVCISLNKIRKYNNTVLLQILFEYILVMRVLGTRLTSMHMQKMGCFAFGKLNKILQKCIILLKFGFQVQMGNEKTA